MNIFISSTYADLQEHRKRVIEAIDRLRHNGADVDWLGMEAFGARDDLPADACVKFVDDCDVYVGFFGVRYGSIDPKSNRSMTEVEYRRAVEKKKHRLIFLLSDDANVKQRDIEASPEGQQKLKQLKEELKKDRVVDFFTTPEDLAYKVATSLQQELRTLAPKSTVPSVFPLPPLPYFVHPYGLQANFTGRDAERRLLTDWLTRGERRTEAILTLEAIGGMGKSALAWYWIHNDLLPQTLDYYSLAGIFWWSFYDDRDLSSFLDKAIAYASGGTLNARDIPSDRERVEAFVTLARQKRFLFALDGFERVLRAYARQDAVYRGDEVESDPQQDYRACADANAGILLRSLASGASLTKILITTRLAPRELDELADARHVELKGMQPDDTLAFFHAQGIRGTRAEILAACEPYAYHPLLLRLLSGALVRDPRYHGDIRNAPRANPYDADKPRHILEFAYNSLSPRVQQFISALAAFRSPLKWEALAAIFAPSASEDDSVSASDGANDAPIVTASAAKQSSDTKEEIATPPTTRLAMTITEDELAFTVRDLVARGLCLHDKDGDTYDLHPVIRRYCYDRLANKAQTHTALAAYFEKIELPQKIQSLADLQPVIELYHHTLNAGRYDEAWILFRDRIWEILYYQLAGYQTQIELLRTLFADGEDKPPRLKEEAHQAHALNELANSYALSGQPRRAARTFEHSIAINEKTGRKESLAIFLLNVGHMAQIQLGELEAAERNLRQTIKICREIDDESIEANAHEELGLVLVYRGVFGEAEKELSIAQDVVDHLFNEVGPNSFASVVRAHRAICTLLKGDAASALGMSREARQFAEETAHAWYPHERDFVRAEWLIGAACVALGNNKAEMLRQAERHLTEALLRDRRINLAEVEAPILLEWAKLRMVQAKLESREPIQQTAIIGHVDTISSLMDESFKFAQEALQIAERCEYRLQLAEIHNFFTEWHLQMAEWSEGDVGKIARATLMQKVKEHAERAKERAWCDGPPYYYKVAYEKAERMLKEVEE